MNKTILNDYQKVCIKSLEDSNALSPLFDHLYEKFFEKAKKELDKPEVFRDTISMSKVLREVEREFKSVINELTIGEK